MPLEIIRNDITKVHADAIVNAADPSLLGGGGTDGAIHKAAGPGLLAECKSLGGCKAGEAKITKGYDLPAKYVIHTVGPVWHDGSSGEEKVLSDCYKNSLKLAKQHKLESVAFPLISSGTFGYPRDKALSAAISAIGEFLLKNDMTVYLVVYDSASFMLSEKLFSSIKQYIDDNYIEEQASNFVRYSIRKNLVREYPNTAVFRSERSLDDVVRNLDETFSQMLLRLIDEKGMKDSETYKKANIDRKLFSKIRNDIYYKPSKQTAVAFAVALELNLDETRDLLGRAGFALSRSCHFDIIIQYFIEHDNYDIFEINEALFAFEQNLIGA
jgi:O-acetyl-ADP-ribose deacetylase (regulator of RNase III)